MNRSLLHILTVLFLLMGNGLAAQEYEAGRYTSKKGYLDYRVLYPVDFKESEKYPVLFFLHGAGERGDDNKKQLVHGSKLFLDSIKKYPAIVIFPQCRKEKFWANVDRKVTGEKREFEFLKGGKPTESMKVLMQLVDSVAGLSFTDKSRFYVGGLSMGGMGTFELVYRKHKTFAAAFVICGAANPEIAKKMSKNTPFWIFHGEKDNVVVPEYAEKMVAAIDESGGSVKFTRYPDANHNSWDPAFAEPGLLAWVFSQKLE